MKKINKYITLITILVLVFIISLFVGSSKISIIDSIKGLFDSSNNTISIIMRNIRLPRVIGAVVAGAGLAASGVLLQNITNNELASPNIIGVNSGAGLITIILLSIFPSLINYISIGSFIGAFLTTILILSISYRIGNNKVSIILSGIAITTLLNAGINLISLIDNDVLDSYKYFSIGSLNGINIKQLIIPIIFIIISLVISIITSSKSETLILGDSLAKSLGTRVTLYRIITILCASMLASAVVSFAGLLGFVGLVVPHIARKINGCSLKNSIITSSIVGAILVLVCDTLGRIIFYPTEIPVGIIMAFVGCPFFIYLLLRRKTYAQN